MIGGEDRQVSLPQGRKEPGQRGIKPESLAAEEDLQKLERRVRSEEKKLAKNTKALPPHNDNP